MPAKEQVLRSTLITETKIARFNAASEEEVIVN